MTNSFDRVANIYSQVRPGYPNELYKRVSEFKSFNQDSLLLEIGAGHGIATEEVNSHWNPKIIALEPGDNLFKKSQQKLIGFPNIKVENYSFEKYNSTLKFDGIYSATAFHWIDQSIKFKKAFQMLNDDGLLFLFWNNYSLKNEQVFQQIQNIYQTFHPSGKGNKDIRILQKDKIQSRRQEVEESKYFNLLSHDVIIHFLIYSADMYVNLLKTFSPNALPKKEIAPFYKNIKEYILSNGDEIELEIVVNLEIAGKDI